MKAQTREKVEKNKTEKERQHEGIQKNRGENNEQRPIWRTWTLASQMSA